MVEARERVQRWRNEKNGPLRSIAAILNLNKLECRWNAAAVTL